MKLPTLLLAIVSVLYPLTTQAEQAASLPFRNPDLPVEKRVDDLLNRLTVEEKIAQTMMATPAVPRLGIPAYHWWNEALHGVARNGTATVFPQAIGLAATWNPELHHQIADVISTEARAKNNELVSRTNGASAIYEGLTIWSPNINIFRDPRWGRGQETYGEDPFLTGRMGVAFVRGLQGDDPRYLKTVATLKHYAVHSGPEQERHRFDARVSERDLRETYLPAFEAGIREGRAWSLMSAYNAINGLPAPANPFLLEKILRDEWGFPGAVVGDVDTVNDLFNPHGHRFSKDAAEASAVAIKSGNDLCSGTTYEALPESLQRGLITEAGLDVALRRLFLVRFKLGQFDPTERVPFTQIPVSEVDSTKHSALALEAARQSLVLLKNDGVLPWDARKIKTVAVIGPTADDRSALLGNYSGFPSRPVTLLKGLRQKLEPRGIQVLYERGVPLVQGYRDGAEPLPEGTFFTEPDLKRTGLAREVFSNADFKGTPTARDRDELMDMRWGIYTPIPGLPVKDSIVRWSGVIVPPASGEYTLHVVASGYIRLILDDRTVIDDWKPEPDRTLTAKVVFTKGKACRVRVDYHQAKGAGRIALGWKPPGQDRELARALEAAKQADQIVLTLGITPDLEGEEMKVNVEGFNGGDRTSIALPATQRRLLAKICALGKPVTVVLTNGSALSFDVKKPNAILEAWYYGQRGGEAVAETLLGQFNPAGRLPITFYRSEDDLPDFADYNMKGRTYRYFTGKPLYAFGHGLSYTSFTYGQPRLSKTTASATDTVNVTVPLTNSGTRAGDEVLQVYVRSVKPPVRMPLQSLVGFQRVRLRAGETKSVTIPVKVDRFRRWDETTHRYVVDPGAYELRVGAASNDIRQTLTLSIP